MNSCVKLLTKLRDLFHPNFSQIHQSFITFPYKEHKARVCQNRKTQHWRNKINKLGLYGHRDGVVGPLWSREPYRDFDQKRFPSSRLEAFLDLCLASVRFTRETQLLMAFVLVDLICCAWNNLRNLPTLSFPLGLPGGHRAMWSDSLGFSWIYSRLRLRFYNFFQIQIMPLKIFFNFITKKSR